MFWIVISQFIAVMPQGLAWVVYGLMVFTGVFLTLVVAVVAVVLCAGQERGERALKTLKALLAWFVEMVRGRK